MELGISEGTVFMSIRNDNFELIIFLSDPGEIVFLDDKDSSRLVLLDKYMGNQGTNIEESLFQKLHFFKQLDNFTLSLIDW